MELNKFGAGGGSGSSGLTVGTTTIANGTTTRILYDNAGVLGEYTISGSGTVVAMATSPVFTTPTLGVASATTINKVTITAPATGSTLTIAEGKTLTSNSSFNLSGTDGKTLTLNANLTISGGDAAVLAIVAAKTLSVNNSLSFSGTDSTTMTFPGTNATIARTDAAQTFTGTQTFSQVITTANAITAVANAATVPVTSKNNIVTNNSAATLTITLTTASAVNMQSCIVQILDFSAVAQTLVFVNTENSTVSVPATSNGSTSLPLTVGFIYNSSTSKWRCIASA